MFERLGVAVGVLQRLADRKVKVGALRVREVVAREVSLHSLYLGRVESKRLEIGQTVIRFTQFGVQGDAATVRRAAVR